MDISQVPALVDNVGWPLTLRLYGQQDLIYPSLGEVLPVTDEFLLGERGETITGVGKPKEIEPGQPIPADQFAPGITWRLKTRKFAHMLPLTFEMLSQSNAVGRVTNLIATHTRKAIENAVIVKEDFIADMFQKGTLTAGDADFFDGTFPNETDPTPKFIYDGQPWFDTTHGLSVGSDTFSNHTVSAALNEANLQAQDTLMSKTSAVDERGERIVNRPDTLLLPTGPLEFTAEILLESLLKTGASTNDKNTMRGKYNLIAWGALDDAASASSWWLGNSSNFGLRIRDSGAPRIGTFIDEEKEVVLVKWVTRFGAGIDDWRGWSAANKAAS